MILTDFKKEFFILCFWLEMVGNIYYLPQDSFLEGFTKPILLPRSSLKNANLL
jgi:hypothetical protein